MLTSWWLLLYVLVFRLLSSLAFLSVPFLCFQGIYNFSFLSSGVLSYLLFLIFLFIFFVFFSSYYIPVFQLVLLVFLSLISSLRVFRFSVFLFFPLFVCQCSFFCILAIAAYGIFWNSVYWALPLLPKINIEFITAWPPRSTNKFVHFILISEF